MGKIQHTLTLEQRQSLSRKELNEYWATRKVPARFKRIQNESTKFKTVDNKASTPPKPSEPATLNEAFLMFRKQGHSVEESFKLAGEKYPLLAKQWLQKAMDAVDELEATSKPQAKQKAVTEADRQAWRPAVGPAKG